MTSTVNALTIAIDSFHSAGQLKVFLTLRLLGGVTFLLAFHLIFPLSYLFYLYLSRLPLTS